ncbi:hypothetical protein HK102_013888 [Quaeritorhiza haematococci]|nr:hypothetical protein HK102_013888 [Quaeritorhiza haematococci]
MAEAICFSQWNLAHLYAKVRQRTFVSYSDFVDIARQTWLLFPGLVSADVPGVALFNKTVYENCLSTMTQVTFINELTSVTFVHDLKEDQDDGGRDPRCSQTSQHRHPRCSQKKTSQYPDPQQDHQYPRQQDPQYLRQQDPHKNPLQDPQYPRQLDPHKNPLQDPHKNPLQDPQYLRHKDPQYPRQQDQQYPRQKDPHKDPQQDQQYPRQKDPHKDPPQDQQYPRQQDPPQDQQYPPQKDPQYHPQQDPRQQDPQQDHQHPRQQDPQKDPRQDPRQTSQKNPQEFPIRSNPQDPRQHATQDPLILDKILTKNKSGEFVNPLVDDALVVRFKLLDEKTFHIDSGNCHLIVLLPGNRLFRCRLIGGHYDMASLIDMMGMVVNQNGALRFQLDAKSPFSFTISAKEPFGLLVENENANFLQRMTSLTADVLKRDEVHINLKPNQTTTVRALCFAPGDPPSNEDSSFVLEVTRDWTDWMSACQIGILRPTDGTVRSIQCQVTQKEDVMSSETTEVVAKDEDEVNGHVMTSLKNNVKEYVTLTQEIKSAKEHIKLLNARVSELESELVEFMKSHDIQSLQISNGKINLYESKTVKPLNRDILTQTIAQKLDPSVAKELVESAFGSRPTATVSKIRIVSDR